MDHHQTQTLPQRATIIASMVALGLVLVKIVIGLLTGSMMVIASAVDSGLDFLISIFNHIAVKKAAKPSDEKYNYGRGKIEALAASLEGVVIVVSSLFILIQSVIKIATGDSVTHPKAAVTVMILSAAVTLALVLYLNRTAKKSKSMVIAADALHYKTDLYSNIGILAALLLIQQTGWRLVDPLISIGIACYIAVSAYTLIRDGVRMLLDRALPSETSEAIINILDNNTDINGWHLLRTRTSANVNFVEVHLVFDKTISLLAAHRISERIEHQIKAIEDANWVINCHLDPVDDSKRDARI